MKVIIEDKKNNRIVYWISDGEQDTIDVMNVIYKRTDRLFDEMVVFKES